jgi:hypothetical protein
MDKNGYQTDEELKEIEILGGILFKKPQTELKFKEFIERLQELWHWDHCVEYAEADGKWTLELHTGGWSGNESIINIVQASFFWFMFWQKSERGGHYYFEGKLNQVKEGKGNEI